VLERVCPYHSSCVHSLDKTLSSQYTQSQDLFIIVIILERLRKDTISPK